MLGGAARFSAYNTMRHNKQKLYDIINSKTRGGQEYYA